MTNEERKAALEAIIYAADEPATIEQLAKALGEEKLAVQASLDELVASYASEQRGIEVRAVAGGYKLYTKPQQHDVVRRFIKSLRPPLRLSMPALETLAGVADKQPGALPGILGICGGETAGGVSQLLGRQPLPLQTLRRWRRGRNCWKRRRRIMRACRRREMSNRRSPRWRGNEERGKDNAETLRAPRFAEKKRKSERSRFLASLGMTMLWFCVCG